MPSVSPPDGGYQYYQKAIGELEDELKTEAKRTQKSQEEQIKEIEDSYRSAIRKQDQELEETIRNVKDNLEETLSHERELNKNEIARIKNDTYDKFGRFQGHDADEQKAKLKTATAGWDTTHKADQKQVQDTETVHNSRLKQIRDEHALALDKAVQTTRDAINENQARTKKESNSAGDDYTNNVKQQYRALANNYAEETNIERRRNDRIIADAKLDLEKQIQRLKESDSARISDQEKAHSDATDLAIRRTADSANEQNQVLREQIKELLRNETAYGRDRTKASADAVKDFEKDWRTREKLLLENYDRDTSAYKRQVKETEEHHGFLKSQAIRDIELRNANLVSRQNAENFSTIRDLEDGFQKDRAQTEIRVQKDRQLDADLRESMTRQANQDRAKLLEEQAKAFNETFNRTRMESDDKIKNLEKELVYRKTAEDPGVISAAAENKIRKSIVQEYDKSLGAEHASNRGALDRLQTQYSNRIQDLSSESIARENSLNQTHAKTLHQERSELLQHIQDAEFTTNMTLNNQENDHRREIENLNRNFAVTLDRQHKQHNEIIEATKNDLYGKNQQLRLDADFSARMAQREFAGQLNQMARESEKRLADQKAEYDALLHDTKGEADRALREQDRQHRQTLSEQEKAFEQKLVQQEHQTKERERVSSQNHQEEIDKIRQANTLLANRRG